MWVYAIHRLDKRVNEEIWFDADELEAVIEHPHSSKLKLEIKKSSQCKLEINALYLSGVDD